jgi:Zn-dependent M28 family amino/carboxypeptidase
VTPRKSSARPIPAVTGLLAFLLAAGCSASNPEPSTKAEAAASPATQAAAPSAATQVSPEDAAPPPEKTAGFDGQKAYDHVKKIVEIGPRPAGSPGIHKAQEYILGQLHNFGCKVEEDDFGASTPVGRIQMKNLLVKIPGASPNAILLTTHYDTLLKDNFVGADDGASSTGLMLELARLFCGRKQDLSIWIAFFDGEEAVKNWHKDNDNTYGSREMAAKLAASGDLKRIKAMMLADIVGSKNLRIKRESNSTPWLTDLVWSTAARLGYSDIFVAEKTAIEDDHLPFLKRGVNCVDVIDLEIPYWHTTQDTLDKISPRSLAIVGHVFAESIGELRKKFR